jgi:hypothetical protein
MDFSNPKIYSASLSPLERAKLKTQLTKEEKDDTSISSTLGLPERQENRFFGKGGNKADNSKDSNSIAKGSATSKTFGAKSSDSAPKDASIFGGKNEVSRMDLKTKLRKDPKVFAEQRKVGLNLSPLERSKLEKEVFSGALGRNISKTDMKFGVAKLNRKLLSTQNPTEHEKIRKEIKFFKKIGGV